MRSLASTRTWPMIGISLGGVGLRDLRSSFSPSFSPFLSLPVSLLRLGFLESGSITRVTVADSFAVAGLGVVSLSSFSCRSFCFFLTFISLRSFELPPTSSFTGSPPSRQPPFSTKHTPHTPLSCPTRVLASTPECALNTLMLEFAKPTTSHDLSRAKEVTVDGSASSGLASEGAMRGREGGKTGVTIWELRSLPPCRQLRPV
jgi:hypothetical protein